RIAVGQLDTRLLAPEEVWHQADEARFGKFVGVVPHRVVDAPNLHDGDDRAGRRAIGNRQIGAHGAIPQRNRDRPRLHGIVQARRMSARALPAKMRSRSAAEMSSAFTALIVSRINARPRSASNGASVAKTQWPVVKKEWPQRVAGASPLSAVSA